MPPKKSRYCRAGAVEDVLPLASAKLDRLRIVEPDAREETFLVPSSELFLVIREVDRQQGGVRGEVGHSAHPAYAR